MSAQSVTYHPGIVHLQKAKLVDLGLFALSRGEWQIVMAITRLIQRGGMSYA